MESITFLLIEDNEGDILLTREALGRGRIQKEVAVVKDRWEGIQFLEKKGAYKNNTPDLMLLDADFPKLNGHEVLARIKPNPQIQHIPVIMLTTSSLESDILKSYQNHVNCFITEPVEAGNFLYPTAAIEDFWRPIVQLPKKN